MTNTGLTHTTRPVQNPGILKIPMTERPKKNQQLIQFSQLRDTSFDLFKSVAKDSPQERTNALSENGALPIKVPMRIRANVNVGHLTLTHLRSAPCAYLPRTCLNTLCEFFDPVARVGVGRRDHGEDFESHQDRNHDQRMDIDNDLILPIWRGDPLPVVFREDFSRRWLMTKQSTVYFHLDLSSAKSNSPSKPRIGSTLLFSNLLTNHYATLGLRCVLLSQDTKFRLLTKQHAPPQTLHFIWHHHCL
ncbi:hypothetical protein EV361DRAFT_955058 [Lentinula raphanica]|nr:hypothetical protein EV361DRAFT_955058 [Lentinula raphanica]